MRVSGRVNPEDYLSTLRTLYEALHESREQMKSARFVINRVVDKARRAQLDAAYQQTEVPFVQAVQAGHQFVYDDLKERLSTARQRLDALLGQLTNRWRGHPVQ